MPDAAPPPLTVGLTWVHDLRLDATAKTFTFPVDGDSVEGPSPTQLLAVSLAACLNLLYALPNADYFECDMDPSPWREEFLRSPLFTSDRGMVEPFDRPGLGLDIDEAALAAWRVAA